MDSRRWQIILLALVATLIVGRGIFGTPETMTLQEVWQSLTR